METSDEQEPPYEMEGCEDQVQQELNLDTLPLEVRGIFCSSLHKKFRLFGVQVHSLSVHKILVFK